MSAAKANALPIESALFLTKDGFLRSTVEQNIYCRPADFPEGMPAVYCVELKRFKDLLPSGSVEVLPILPATPEKFAFLMGRAKYEGENLHHIDDAPDHQIIGVEKKSLRLPADVLIKSLKFVGNDDLRPAMQGVNIRKVAASVAIEATDAHRLIQTIIPAEDTGEEFSYIIPPNTLKVLASSKPNGEILINATEDARRISLSWTDQYGNGWGVDTLPIDAIYPNIEAVMPDLSSLKSAKVSPSKWVEALKVAEKGSNPVTKQVHVNGRITAEDLEYNTAFSVPSPDETGIDAHFNASILGFCFSMMDGEDVRLHYNPENKARAVVLTDGLSKVLCMPVVVKP